MVLLGSLLSVGLSLSLTTGAAAEEHLSGRTLGIEESNSKLIASYGADLKRLHHSMKRARSIIEDRDVAVKVPTKELSNILTKIEALEKQVKALMGEGEDTSGNSGGKAGDDDCDAENLLYQLGAEPTTDAAGKVSDHPMFRRSTNCSMEAVVSGKQAAPAGSTKVANLKAVEPSSTSPASGSEEPSPTSAGSQAEPSDDTASVDNTSKAQNGKMQVAPEDDKTEIDSSADAASSSAPAMPETPGTPDETKDAADDDYTTTTVIRTKTISSTVIIPRPTADAAPSSEDAAPATNGKFQQDDEKNSNAENEDNNDNDDKDDKDDKDDNTEADGEHPKKPDVESASPAASPALPSDTDDSTSSASSSDADAVARPTSTPPKADSREKFSNGTSAASEKFFNSTSNEKVASFVRVAAEEPTSSATSSMEMMMNTTSSAAAIDMEQPVTTSSMSTQESSAASTTSTAASTPAAEQKFPIDSRPDDKVVDGDDATSTTPSVTAEESSSSMPITSSVAVDNALAIEVVSTTAATSAPPTSSLSSNSSDNSIGGEGAGGNDAEDQPAAEEVHPPKVKEAVPMIATDPEDVSTSVWDSASVTPAFVTDKPKQFFGVGLSANATASSGFKTVLKANDQRRNVD